MRLVFQIVHQVRNPGLHFRGVDAHGDHLFHASGTKAAEEGGVPFRRGEGGKARRCSIYPWNVYFLLLEEPFRGRVTLAVLQEQTIAAGDVYGDDR